MTQTKRSRLAKLLMGATLIALLQGTSPTWAADCAKTTDAKLSVCTNAKAKPGAGSQMQEIPLASAGEQKKAAQSLIDTKTATSPKKTNREKRLWAAKTDLTCKKGAITLHLAAPATQCPTGFKKS